MTGSNEIFIGISFIDVKCIVVDTQIYTSNYVEVFFFLNSISSINFKMKWNLRISTAIFMTMTKIVNFYQKDNGMGLDNQCNIMNNIFDTTCSSISSLLLYREIYEDSLTEIFT